MRHFFALALLASPAALTAQAPAARAERTAAVSRLRERIVARFGAAEVMDRQGEVQVLRLKFLDPRYRRLGRAMDDSMAVVLRFVAAEATGTYRPDSVDIHFLVRDTIIGAERRTEWVSRAYPFGRKP